eukprot:TRINITY_DN8253_c0_g1_i1.p1 TRINITY_DN8253_c0_g1~~TRINITY_DN8253_c0_g1_i1.p1  ORF type:complete len:142 (+),score=18.78 TRINITY_DN8253_c0_g1_i1:54-479(+)
MNTTTRTVIVGALLLLLLLWNWSKGGSGYNSQVVHFKEINEAGVSHNPSIKKKTLLKQGMVPHVVYMSRSIFKPGDSAPGHSHSDMHEVFYVEGGVATFAINGAESTLVQGSTIHVAPNEVHEITNRGDEELTLVYYGVGV